MNFKKKSQIFRLLLFVIISNPSFSQNIIPNVDFESVQYYSSGNILNQIYNLKPTIGFFKDNSGVWFVNESDKKFVFEKLNYKKTTIEPLFNHQKLADSISKIFDNDYDKNNLPITIIECKSFKSILLNINNIPYILNTDNYTLQAISLADKKLENNSEFELKSPDGKWIAFSKNYNLYIKSTSDNSEIQLSLDGKENYEVGSYYGYDELIKGEKNKRPPHFWVNWTPDSKYILTEICDSRYAPKKYLLDYTSSKNSDLYSYFQANPGDTNDIKVIPVLYNIESKKEVLRLDLKEKYANIYGQTNLVKQNKILFYNMVRGFKSLAYKTINLESAKIETLFTEKSNTNITTTDDGLIYLLPDESKFIFMSERSGWQHLYSYDFNSKTINAITSGNFRVDKFVRFDEKTETVYFLASNKTDDVNPYNQHLYSVNLNGGNIKDLSPENGFHKIQFSPDNNFIIDEVSTIEIAPKFYLKDISGKSNIKLLETDISNLTKKGFKAPKIFNCVGKDGKMQIYGAIWKPTNFDPSKKYPIIDLSYTGPHANIFPRTFIEFAENEYGLGQNLAELGFIVMIVDGLGTNGRSKSFQDVSYRNLGNGLDDHVLAIKYLANKYSWIDIDKVGIYGTSFGGYDAARALLKYPDFYKVGVSVSGNHDFKSEDDYYLEMYMGLPVDSTYDLNSNIDLAKNLKGKLLLMHGVSDERVNISATYKLSQALINANKDFDMFIFPNQGHFIEGKSGNLLRMKTFNYFLRHLKN